MKRFAFRLARLLELRESAEREQARAIGRALGTEMEQQARTTASAERLEEVQHQTVQTEAPTAAGMLCMYRLALEAAALQFESDAAALHLAHEVRMREADRFTVIQQERQVVERMRDRRRAVWEQEAVREEQAALDEVAQRTTAERPRS
ncbi:MAG: hypothetical protein HOP28_06710 [Gemmatimonadales bacterium]|nr:hypothetical protein [Gemmatimonadales bacterium]